MAPRIRVLSGAVVDQIAAGEVVERPASVVKELLENALDAGATTVEVEVDLGGLGRIRVSDDGVGMAPEDALLAVQRHATSKITSHEDLTAIRTLGFRGEALPSIASVSRFTLTTRERDASGGTRVRIEGGDPPRVMDVGCAPGTVVEVEDLFFNVPARRKFLRSPGVEQSHLAEVCLRAALALPALRLRLLRDGRLVRELLPTSGTGDRAQEAFRGERLAALAGARDGVRVEAFLAPPERARSGAGALHVLVNGRPVRDRVLARAVAFAYGSVLPPGRYPVGVVHLEVPPDEVDVNVHPQKAEVRFARGRAVPDAVTRVLAEALGTTAWGRPAAPTHGEPPRPAPPHAAPRGATPGAARGADRGDAADPWGLAAFFGGRAAGAPAAADEVRDDAGADPAPTLFDAPGFFGRLRVLAQVRRTFLVCEGDDGLYVLDQHAADERVRYHRLREAHGRGAVERQALLFPETVELDAREAARLAEASAELAALGVEAELLGPTTAAVRAVPALVRRAPPERLLRDLLAELDHAGERAYGDAIDMAIATLACHGAIRAGDALGPEEWAALLRALDEVPAFAGHCPHGRPVVFEIGFRALERGLGR